MQKTNFALAALAALCLSTAARADTGWMTAAQARAYKPFIERQVYGTAIECRQGAQQVEVKLRTHAVDANKPFHKWQFLIVKSSELAASIAAIPLRGCLETRMGGGWPGSDVIPNGCRSQFGEPHVDADHPAAA